MKSWFASLRNGGLALQSAVLLLAVAALYGLISPVVAYLGGAVGLAAAAIAAGLCLLGAGLALGVCRLFRDPRHALHGVLIGMLLRMGIPLFSALAFLLQGGPLAKAGLLVYLLVFYLVTLSVQTALSLPSDEQPQHRSDIPGNAAL